MRRVLHHVVYQQEVRRHGGNISDLRNLMEVENRAHERHHGRSEPFSLDSLPSCAFEYASELLGPEKAYNYLRRRYGGEDPRLDALLQPTDAEIERFAEAFYRASLVDPATKRSE